MWRPSPRRRSGGTRAGSRSPSRSSGPSRRNSTKISASSASSPSPWPAVEHASCERLGEISVALGGRLVPRPGTTCVRAMRTRPRSPVPARPDRRNARGAPSRACERQSPRRGPGPRVRRGCRGRSRAARQRSSWGRSQSDPRTMTANLGSLLYVLEHERLAGAHDEPGDALAGGDREIQDAFRRTPDRYPERQTLLLLALVLQHRDRAGLARRRATAPSRRLTRAARRAPVGRAQAPARRRARQGG